MESSAVHGAQDEKTEWAALAEKSVSRVRIFVPDTPPQALYVSEHTCTRLSAGINKVCLGLISDSTL